MRAPDWRPGRKLAVEPGLALQPDADACLAFMASWPAHVCSDSARRVAQSTRTCKRPPAREMSHVRNLQQTRRRQDEGELCSASFFCRTPQHVQVMSFSVCCLSLPDHERLRGLFSTRTLLAGHFDKKTFGCGSERLCSWTAGPGSSCFSASRLTGNSQGIRRMHNERTTRTRVPSSVLLAPSSVPLFLS